MPYSEPCSVFDCRQLFDKKKAAETPMIEISAAKVMFFNEAIPIPHLYPMKNEHPIHIWMFVCVINRKQAYYLLLKISSCLLLSSSKILVCLSRATLLAIELDRSLS